MKRKTQSSIDRLSRWLLSLLGAGVAMTPAASGAAEEASAEEAEETPVLSPEEFFEGGANPYDNWVELAVGGWFPSGNESQFQQRHNVGSEFFGGLEDFHYKRDLGKEVLLEMDGRAIFDNEDYKVRLDLSKFEKWYLRFDYEQFRTWYNADAGYYPPTGAWYPFGDEALGLDRGQITFEAGVTLDNLPDLAFRYTHRFRDGQKSSTSWGYAYPDPANPTVRRYLTPGVYDIDETVDIFELDLSHQIKATDLGAGVRFETGDLENTYASTSYDFLGNPLPVSDTEGTSYDLLNVHAFTETWIKENLLFSSGFLFTDVDNDFSGNRASAIGLGYTGLNGGSRLHEYTLNLNLMSRPWTHFTIVPSVRVQKEDWDADSNSLLAGLASSAQSDRDALDVREQLDLRYTGVTNWVFYGRGEWTQGDGERNESGVLGLTPIPNQEVDDSRFFQKYVLGIDWYPVRRVSTGAQYYYQVHDYDYDHTPSGNLASIRMQGFQTHDVNFRLSWRPNLKLTLTTGYDFQYHTLDTEPDPAFGTGEQQTAQTTQHIVSQNISWTPWTRLFLQVGFNYVLDATDTPAADYPDSPILDSQNNYWTLNFSSAFVLTDRTDLHAGYFFYQADNNDVATVPVDGSVTVPYGAGATEHGITCGVSHRLRENIRLNLRYGFAQYNDDTSGGNLDYDSHLVYGSVQYRF